MEKPAVKDMYQPPVPHLRDSFIVPKVGNHDIQLSLLTTTALLELAEMQADMEVAMSIQDGNIVIHPKPKRRYTLKDLIAKCDTSQPEGDREWLDAPSVGEELL